MLFHFCPQATQSLFFASDALFVIFWDMALGDPKTYPRGRRRGRAGSDHSDEEDGYDHFAAEEASRRADRALERRVDDDMSAWVDHVLRSVEERRNRLGGAGSRGGRCSILPVAVAPASAHGEEIRRRCDLLRCRLSRRFEVQARRSRISTQSTAPTPELVFPGDGGTVLCVGTDNGAVPLKAAVESVAAGRRRECSAVPRPALSPRASSTDTIALVVRNIVQELKQEHKVVATARIVQMLQQIIKYDEAAAKNAVVKTLQSLSEDGEVLYFGGALQVSTGTQLGCIFYILNFGTMAKS